MKPTHLLPFIIVPIALFGGVVAGFMSARDQPKVARQPPAYQQSFAKARKSFQTQLQRQEFSNDPVPNPPRTIARKVKFPSSAGQLSAYITLPPAKPSNSTKPTAPAKSPAIVWLGGGFCNCIDGDFWKPAPRTNDQTASAFRKAGIITMYPARRE